MQIVKFLAGRDCYDKIEAARGSFTVRELINELENYPDDAKIIFSNDGGYTYGYFDGGSINFDYSKIPNLSNTEKDEIEESIENVIYDVAEAHELYEWTSGDVLAYFDEICEKANLEDNEDYRKYAEAVIRRVY